MTRPLTVRCDGCGADVPQGARGPVRHWCKRCRNRRSNEKRAKDAVCLNPSCGKAFRLKPGRTGYCSLFCHLAVQHQRQFQRQPEPCPACGQMFQPRPSQAACSLACKHALQRRHASTEDRYRARDSRRRARMDALPHEPYTLAEIAGCGECWLCGESVDMTLPRTADMGPTVDHVIPIYHGGWDVRMNVRLAHKACNVRRGRRVVLADLPRLTWGMWCTPRNVEDVRLMFRPELVQRLAALGLTPAFD